MSLEGCLLGHYQLLQQIGSGGMGTVYLAQDTHLPREVAIKVVRTDTEIYHNSEAAEKMARLFQREVQTIARLDHSHILPVFDSGEMNISNARYIYLVMPYRPEGSLVDWLHKRQQSQPLALQEIGTLIQQAAEALQYAHEHGVVHQDVKPSNFLLRTRTPTAGQPETLPELLLADFGVARILTAIASTTTQGIRGTPFYMAPEQWDGRPVQASDQYALAIMTFQLLTGQFPFQGGPGQVMRKHYMEQPPAPSSINPHLPSALDAVILRALSKQATERFPEIQEFAHAFTQALYTSGVLSMPHNVTEDATLLLSQSASATPAPLADKTAPTIESPTLLASDSTAHALPAEATSPVIAEDSVGTAAPLVPEIAPASPIRRSATMPSPWLTPTDPDDLQALLDRPLPRKKHTALYKGLLVGMLALIVLAASGLLLYSNTPRSALGSTLSTLGTQQQGQTSGTNGVPGSAAGAATATHSSVTTGGPGSTPPIGGIPTYPPGVTSAPTPQPGVTSAPTPRLGITPTPVPTPQPGVTPTPTAPPPTPVLTPTPIPTPGPNTNLLVNPGFEGPNGWCAWDNHTSQNGCNGDFEDSKQESGNSHGGGWHRVNGYATADITTFQVINAPVTGNYYASVWVETGCNTTGTYFFLKDASTGRASGVNNIGACVQGWSYVRVGPFAGTQGERIDIELRSINTTNQWARFDDASLWYA